MIGLAGTLLILGVALHAMQGASWWCYCSGYCCCGLEHCCRLNIVNGGPFWGELLMGLGGLAGILVILGVAGYVLGPVTPVIALAFVGMAARGIGMLAVAAAALVFGMALKTIFEVVMLGQTALM